MRLVKLQILMLALAFAPAVSYLDACGPYPELEPTAVKFPGIAHTAVLRGDYLLCANDAHRIIAVDLKGGKTFDLGSAKARRWHDGDIADGQALLLEQDRLLVVALKDGKTVLDVAIGSDAVWAFGFAGN